MSSNHKPVRYEHDYCNIPSGSIHRIARTDHKILTAAWITECVLDEGLDRLQSAIDTDDIHTVIVTYADCFGKLENALLVFQEYKTIYDDDLASYARKSERLAQRLMTKINQLIDVYRIS